MSLRRRLFLTLCLIVLLGFFSIARWIQGELRDGYSQIVEEILVDYAHLVAAHIENQKMSPEGFHSLEDMFQQYKTHPIQAKIFDFVKDKPALELYVTDHKGLVVFSTLKKDIGKDFSQWNDVYKTLRGEYGARSTRVHPTDSQTSVYYVAAPIMIDSKIAGVATIYKTESSILLFLNRALRKMFLGGLFSVLALGLIGGLIMLWITLPLERLRTYALEASEGRRGNLPKSNIKEVKHLGEAFEKMRVSLEGKKTAEKYTQTLTHELKSPLTAIKGAAELCLEEMDRQQQKVFLKNIIDESNRSHNLLEQLLKIAALETKQSLDQTSPVDLAEVLNEVVDAMMGLWKAKNVEIHLENKRPAFVEGDRLLLFQAFRNLLQNAIEFSDLKDKIQIHIEDLGDKFRIKIKDEGTGIPEYALSRIFDKFYSLERPNTKGKSSGLGLSLVKEIVDLHGGQISFVSPLENQRGTMAVVELPKLNGS